MNYWHSRTTFTDHLTAAEPTHRIRRDRVSVYFRYFLLISVW